MDEFLEMLRELMGDDEQIAVAQVGNSHLIMRSSNDIPKEDMIEISNQVLEENEGSKIHYLTGKSAVEKDSVNEFNSSLDSFLEKHNLTPMEFGLDFNIFGMAFALKGDFSESQVKEMVGELLDVCGTLKGKLRTYFLDSKGDILGIYEDTSNGVGRKARNSLAPKAKSHPVNRGVIKESEITDLKIVLNRDDQRDCLEVLEELMRIGG